MQDGPPESAVEFRELSFQTPPTSPSRGPVIPGLTSDLRLRVPASQHLGVAAAEPATLVEPPHAGVAPSAALDGAAARALAQLKGPDPLTLGVLSAPVTPMRVSNIEFPEGMSPRPVKTKAEPSHLQLPDLVPPPSPKRFSKDGGILRKSGPLAPHSPLREEDIRAMLVK